MIPLQVLACILICWYVVERYLSLRRNIRLAKTIKLPYVVVPLYTATPAWYFCYKVFILTLKKLPISWTSPWLNFLDPYWSWNLGHKPFARLGNDTIMVVAPGGIIFSTCDPRVITEVAGRRWDFVKPIESYVFLDLFGPSLVTREGTSWRAHQKVIAPAVSERNAKIVWEESLIQAEAMLQSWANHQLENSKYIETIREDTMTLPFHVINKAGFGVHLPWPTWKRAKDPFIHATGVDEIGPGHMMSYRQALQSSITYLFHILIFPDRFLRIVPFGYAKLLHTAHHECVHYLRELMTEKEEEFRSKGKESNFESKIDIMSALIGAKLSRESSSSKEKETETFEDKEVFTDKAILANMFVMLIAGHETTGTALIVALTELALNPDWQRRIQDDIDEIFGDRSPSSWDLYTDVEKTFDGILEATINEVLRLYAPTNIIPKGTGLDSPQTIISGDYDFTVPGNTAFQIVVSSAHRNPKYWPSGPAPLGKTDDLDEFRPQRWLKQDPPAVANSSREEEPDTRKTDEVLSSDTSAALFRPFPGSYIPFSTGHRRCIGRRFAQVELLAVLAIVFKSHTIEVDVEDIVDGESFKLLTADQKKAVWTKAAAKTKSVLREGMRHHLTMQHKEGKIALRLVKRGEERFS